MRIMGPNPKIPDLAKQQGGWSKILIYYMKKSDTYPYPITGIKDRPRYSINSKEAAHVAYIELVKEKKAINRK